MSLPNNSTKTKFALDLYTMQMKWSLWYIPIVSIIYFIALRFVPDVTERDHNFIFFLSQPSRIYMAIIAMISCFSFLGYAVKNGITRRDYFLASALAAVGVAFSIMIISAILAGILDFLGWYPIITSIEFLETTSVWIIPVIVLSLIILCYYIAGWIIAIGFYRFGGLIGLPFIGIAILFVALIDLIWTGDISHPITISWNIPFPNLSILISIVITLIILAFGLWLIRSMTKRISIKIE